MTYYADNTQKLNNLLDACQNGDLKTVSELIESFDFNLPYNVFNKNELKLLSTATKCGHLEIVKFLFNSPYSKEYINTTYNIQSALSHAISNESLPIISYLMNEPELNRGNLFHESFNYPLSKAASSDSLELFKTLLNLAYPENSPKHLLSQENKLTFACYEQNHKIIKYVINTPELQEYLDVGTWFEIAATYNNEKLLNFFIFDFKIEQTDKIKNLIQEHCLEEVKALFETRDFKEELNSELENQNKSEKKLKV